MHVTRLFCPPLNAARRGRVSIPFIAGQWSLLRRGGPRPASEEGLNPLHCGAVVASPIIVYLVSGRPPSLNPLHCGAVVASGALRKALPALAPESQSPSLRGSGRFCLRHVLENDPDLVSIPFIAGQWSLRRPTWRHGVQEVWSQSPSLRGSGRFREPRCGRPTAARPVSIPFIAGQWSLPQGHKRSHPTLQVSIPFIAGQWSLHRGPPKEVRLAPLVSIPFIAGQWSLLR